MKLDSIRVAQNGFVLEDNFGNLHIAKTLYELAQIAGENVPDSNVANYATGFDSNDLNNVKNLAREGRKIDAIKLLRDCFVPRLGLREAKELVETMTR